MMSHELLKERKLREAEQEAKIRQAFSCRKPLHADLRREKKQKKKTISALLPMLALKGIGYDTIRPAETYVPRSYNLDKQLVGLLNHLFVQYSVPGFLYQACLAETTPAHRHGRLDRFACMQDEYRRWFVTLAQGGSFPKLVKGLMTSKEACAFLHAPSDRKIHENVWWAKMTVAGIPNALIGRLIDRIFTDYFFDDPDGRLGETILFYARQHQNLGKHSLEEVTDFLADRLRYDPLFRLKGRTAASVVKLSNEWHVQTQRAKLGKHIEWEGLQIPVWEYIAKSETWEVFELRDNRELVNEGRKQKHCVYSYVQHCVTGQSAIFSMRAHRKLVASYALDGTTLWCKDFETRRITIEVSPSRDIVQVRGPLNRPPVADEKFVLRLWAGEKGIRTAPGV